jgi:hypothetical protein
MTRERLEGYALDWSAGAVATMSARAAGLAAFILLQASRLGHIQHHIPDVSLY